MHGEIKILVYILIGAVYLFSRFYKKEKRKQDERRINRRPTNTQTAEQIFRELQRSLRLPGTEKPETQKPETEKPETEKPQTRTIMQRPAIEKKPAYTYDRPIREERMERPASQKSSIAKKAEQRKDEKHAKAERELTLAESMEFDPRKAVIFSEILRRPYEL